MKRFKIIVCATVLSMIMSIPACAGQWFSDGYGWKWINDNGTVSANTWQWIDGNYDGIAECYYFNPQGYCLLNTITPDGYMVNASGAWMVNGAVQMQQTFPVQNQVVNNVVAPVNVLELEPVDEYDFFNSSSQKTTQGQEWLGVGCLFSMSFNSKSHVEYYIGDQYTTHTFTYAPRSEMSAKYNGLLKVYGDNNALLWKSDTINYKTSAQNVSVNITGHQYIKFTLDSSRSGDVLLKDVLVQ